MKQVQALGAAAVSDLQRVVAESVKEGAEQAWDGLFDFLDLHAPGVTRIGGQAPAGQSSASPMSNNLACLLTWLGNPVHIDPCTPSQWVSPMGVASGVESSWDAVSMPVCQSAPSIHKDVVSDDACACFFLLMFFACGILSCNPV